MGCYREKNGFFYFSDWQTENVRVKIFLLVEFRRLTRLETVFLSSRQSRTKWRIFSKGSSETVNLRLERTLSKNWTDGKRNSKQNWLDSETNLYLLSFVKIPRKPKRIFLNTMHECKSATNKFIFWYKMPFLIIKLQFWFLDHIGAFHCQFHNIH